MATSTPRLGLVKPLTSEPYDVGVPNGNMDLIDAAPANVTICTSSSRPSTPDDGDVIYETDSGPNILVRQDGGWKAGMGKVYVCTSGTRPGSTLTYNGFPIYETDTGNHLIRNAANTAWLPLSPYSVADAAAQSALGSLPEGFITYRRDLNIYYIYDGVHFPLTPTSPLLCDVYQSSAQSLSNNTWTAITFTQEIVDSATMHSTSTNTSRITIPSGYPTAYYAVGGIFCTASGSGAASCAIAKNGTRLAGSVPRIPMPADGFGIGLPTREITVPLTGGDYVELHGVQASGGSVNTWTGADETSELGLRFLRFA